MLVFDDNGLTHMVLGTKLLGRDLLQYQISHLIAFLGVVCIRRVVTIFRIRGLQPTHTC